MHQNMKRIIYCCKQNIFNFRNSRKGIKVKLNKVFKFRKYPQTCEKFLYENVKCERHTWYKVSWDGIYVLHRFKNNMCDKFNKKVENVFLKYPLIKTKGN